MPIIQGNLVDLIDAAIRDARLTFTGSVSQTDDSLALNSPIVVYSGSTGNFSTGSILPGSYALKVEWNRIHDHSQRNAEPRYRNSANFNLNVPDEAGPLDILDLVTTSATQAVGYNRAQIDALIDEVETTIEDLDAATYSKTETDTLLAAKASTTALGLKADKNAPEFTGGLTVAGGAVISSGGLSVAGGIDLEGWTAYPTLATFATSDQSLTSQTTLQNANSLGVLIAANKAYRFCADLQFNLAGATSGLKIGVTGPASPASLILNAYSQLTLNPAPIAAQVSVGAFGTLLTLNGASFSPTTGLKFARVWGVIRNGANSGALQIQFAQNVSDASAVTLRAGSILEVARLN